MANPPMICDGCNRAPAKHAVFVKGEGRPMCSDCAAGGLASAMRAGVYGAMMPIEHALISSRYLPSPSPESPT